MRFESSRSIQHGELGKPVCDFLAVDGSDWRRLPVEADTVGGSFLSSIYIIYTVLVIRRERITDRSSQEL